MNKVNSNVLSRFILEKMIKIAKHLVNEITLLMNCSLRKESL